MKITYYTPTDWIDLQNQVCKFLNEAGYIAESPKEIDTVRGRVEVDVYANSDYELIKKFICECKYWNTPIPKEKVHAFRTVVHDSGSTVGIIISKEGFQSGAYEAAYCTNVLLKTWEEFLELIKIQWLRKQLIKIKKVMHPLAVYTDILDVPYEKLSVDDKEKYMRITEKCIGEYLVCRELTISMVDKDNITVGTNCFEYWDELFSYFESVTDKAIKDYEELFKNNPVDEWKFEGWEHMLFSNLFDNNFQV